MNSSRSQVDDNFQSAHGETLGGDAQVINLDIAFARIGGFGLFQKLAILGLAMLRFAGNWLFYLYVYLTLPQEYECKVGDEWVSCGAEDTICPAREQGQPVEYRVDTSYQYYMKNWQ